MAETCARTTPNLVQYESQRLANCAEKTQFLSSLNPVNLKLSSAKTAKNERKVNAYWYIGLTKTKIKQDRKKNRRDLLEENESE